MHSMTEDDIAGFIRQICEILNEWHAKNVVHLDLRVSTYFFFAFTLLNLLTKFKKIQKNFKSNVVKCSSFRDFQKKKNVKCKM